MAKNPVWTQEIILGAVVQSFVKLHPKTQFRNFVMFCVFLCSLGLTGVVLVSAVQRNISAFECNTALWLWFTVLFANFSEALSEGRGRAQAESLRKTRTQGVARIIQEADIGCATPHVTHKSSAELVVGDLALCESGDLIPGDGEVIWGIAAIDESAITGESAPVIRESGGDRSAVTGGTRVSSDRIIVRITQAPGDSFVDRMIKLVEGASRQRTPNEIALSILLVGLTIVFIAVIGTLPIFFGYAATESHLGSHLSFAMLASLLVCLIPTTIGGLLSAIGISGMDRLIQRNVIAKSGKAVEAAGDVDVLLLDKTGTITLGNRMASRIVAGSPESESQLTRAAYLSSASDDTPEGRSIVVLLKNSKGKEVLTLNSEAGDALKFVPFSARTRMSGADAGGSEYRKGAVDAVRTWVESKGGKVSAGLLQLADQMASQGSTPLLVAQDNQALGVIELKDIVKGGIRERFAQLRKMGIRTVMITGDNPKTAAAIAAEAGVDDFIAEATPEMKLERIRKEQKEGHLVAMIGDGTNDAPALAQADVGIAMNTGTQAAREAGNMVDLESNPTKLIDVVEIGKQLLMTRGSLTTFSIANDVAKYFAILPALFITLYPLNPEDARSGVLGALDIMKLSSPESAILSAVIFNALIIVALIPLALKGVKLISASADVVLRRNVWIYGFGGIIAPFVGIKAIDIIIGSFLGGAL